MKARPMDVRIITAINDDGKEQVFFTEDFDLSAEDCVCSGYRITADEICECELPDVFPLETTLNNAF